MMKGETEYGVKIGAVIVKRTTNQKKARRVFRKERARHGGKVKFVEIRRQ